MLRTTLAAPLADFLSTVAHRALLLGRPAGVASLWVIETSPRGPC